ncbi:hypothetical protein HYU06_02140 [Candidatus Woesearchaeota archaeon]|nr:hypothetical protein [Candidatus Woesearchaeota archaeon]
MSRLNPNRVGLSLGISGAAISAICGILVLLFPNAMVNLANYIFHGLDVTKIASKVITLRNFVFGIIAVFVWAYLTGYIFVIAYNKLSQRA